jgi:molecular chaperone GrpE
MQSSPASDPGQGGQDDRDGQASGQDAADRARPQMPREDGAGEPAQQRAPGPQSDLQAEIATLEERYKRALADLENYRKRMGRELERRVAECREGVIRDWLEAVDSVERALRMSPDAPSTAGLQAVLEQMEAILRREGVQRVGAPGEPFDPERFEAVGVRDTSEVPDRTVVEVVRSGFGSDGHVLRPAQVIVADAHAHDG